MMTKVEKQALKLGVIGTLFVVLFVGTVWVFTADNSTTAMTEQEQYCEMVKIYIDSNGQYGWPDFRNIYYRECVKQ